MANSTVTIHSESTGERHGCNTTVKGNKIIWTCGQCSYRREYDPATNKNQLIDRGDESAAHYSKKSLLPTPVLIGGRQN